MINIALIGYGKMGRMIEYQAAMKGFKVQAKVDPNESNCLRTIDELTDKNIDVCIDFSHPDTAIKNMHDFARLKLNAVIGTSGWYDNIEEIQKIVEESGIGLVYGANFSVGMNLYYQIIEHSIKLLNNVADYDIYGYEAHHNKKADSPSGTAKELSSIIINNSNTKKRVVYDMLNRQPEFDELHFASIRGGTIPGTHVIGFDSFADTIEIKHTARNREGFAAGALFAAQWISNMSGFYSFRTIFGEILNG
ncbi:MAG TPA: 4-hydroxy-tetrahydrodipicolinate reductase [Candidatus Cloacimonadota bacterium]|nr:4-hydroxy-tetrahydrodipicolinate reductase [Candidatus Cloacimonadota bacterium]